MSEKRLIVRCKNGHGFLVKEDTHFENECPYCETSLYKPKKVNIRETFNLHFIHREQINKRDWKVKRK